MKKLITIITLLVTMSLSGCSLNNERINLLDASSKSEYEAMKYVEDTVIKALETKDKKLLKSIFSKHALKYSKDIDEGIDYMFNVYEGKFKKNLYENHASDMRRDNGKKRLDYGAWIEFKTTEGEYRLGWEEYISNDFNPSKKGVYFLRLMKKTKKINMYAAILGVSYPRRMHINKSLGIIRKAFRSDEVKSDSILNILSKKAKENINTNKNVKKIVEKLDYGDYSSIWVDNRIVNGNNKQNVYAYIKVRIEGTDEYESYLLYFNYDLDEKEKISVMKLIKIDSLENLDKYDLGEHITEPGVYLSEDLE